MQTAPPTPEQRNAIKAHPHFSRLLLEASGVTDADWLYGAERTDIRDQIWNGHGGVMPTWEARFSPETIKALTVYVHANAGGQ